MPLSHTACILALGMLGLFLVPALSQGTPSSMMRSETSPEDSTGARIFLERQGERLRVQGAYVNADTPSGTLAYELDVRRVGEAGTSQSTQSGRFETAPGQTDSLSTVQINVQSGDQVTLHLTIRRGETLVDETGKERTY